MTLPDWWPHPKPYAIMDCIEGMKGLPDKCVDLVLTDPPYGVGLDYGETYEDSFENWCNLIELFLPQALRISKGFVVIPTSKLESEQYLFTKHLPIWRICWFKGASCTRSPVGFKDWETNFLYGKNNGFQFHDYFTAHANDIRELVPGHPCPKPDDWGLWMVMHLSRPGDVVLDPFLGSGTTLRACRETGRIGLGFEINPEYEKIIQKRMMEDIPEIESWFLPEGKEEVEKDRIVIPDFKRRKE